MKLKIVSIDYAPDDLYRQIPCSATLIKKMKGPDRPDYWLAKVDKPIIWEKNKTKDVNYIILASFFVGTSIKVGFGKISMRLAYVIDESILKDIDLIFEKAEYVAICEAEEIKKNFWEKILHLDN